MSALQGCVISLPSTGAVPRAASTGEACFGVPLELQEVIWRGCHCAPSVPAGVARGLCEQEGSCSQCVSQVLALMPEGAWVAQSVERLTSVQSVISWFVSLSPVSGPLLSEQSLLRILSLCPFRAQAYALCLKNKH